jgi:transaldolase
MNPLQSLVACGTQLWLDSVDPEEIAFNRAQGATGATSNPIIIADLIRSGRFDDVLVRWLREEKDDAAVAWRMTDYLVRQAQQVFEPVWEATEGDDGWVSLEVDPLIEDPAQGLSVEQRRQRYIQECCRWSNGHTNRLIKIPATQAGLAALEEVVAAGISVNVTLLFTERQYTQARDACWRGLQRCPQAVHVKTVYSIFVSRIDVYTEKHCPQLSPVAQGQVGIVNAKLLWRKNKAFWADKGCKLRQQIVFASTGVKKPQEPPWKYVEALAGDDIQTNPPATNCAVYDSGLSFRRRVDEWPPSEVLHEIAEHVDPDHMEKVLMTEGIAKFADPHKELLQLIAHKRATLTS